MENKIKLDRYIPRLYQLPLCDAIENKGYKRVIGILPRRAGKDLTAWNLCIRQCLRKTCLVYYCLPTYSQAKKTVFDAIAIDGTKFIDYIPKELIASVNSQEMKIRFVNDSILQLIGSDTYDTSLVGTNPYAIVFSEAALMDPRAYQFARPILAANDGWCLLISCVAPNTLVISKNGLQRISTVLDSREMYTDLHKPIWGLKGFHNAEQFYYGGRQKTKKIILSSGYEIECTPIHPLWNGKEWIKAQDLKVGDLLPIQYGQNIWGNGLNIETFDTCRGGHGHLNWTIDNLKLDNNFFYLLGLIHADGSYDRNKVTVTKKKDPEIIKFLHDYGFKTFKDGIHHNLSSREFVKLLEYLGFKHGARNKTFPERMFECTKEQMKSFIQGLFDGDGTSNSCPSKRGYIKLTSTCKSFLRDLQVILLNFGIVGSIRPEDKAPTNRVKVWSRIYNLEIMGYFAHIFYKDIGFRLKRKQKNYCYLPEKCRQESGNIYPIDLDRLKDCKLPKSLITNPNRMSRRTLKMLASSRPHQYFDELLAEQFFYSPIVQILDSENEVFDFVIPDTHSFFSNGFISHNTPRGRNWLFDLYTRAKELPDWFTYKLTVEDTKHVSPEVLETERQQTSEELHLQEWYTSFDRGVEGSFYAKYLDRIRSNNQIGIVPWSPALKTHVAIDLGVHDATCIIFFQVLQSGVINIIDSYSNTNVGLDHYVKVLQSKPYTYGAYLGPHDLAVREWAGGAVTRLDKARQLGVNFTIVPNLSIDDGIEAVWTAFNRFYIDEAKCKPLIHALENYRREWDEQHNRYRDKPVHDAHSNWCDALRYLCLGLPKLQDGTTKEDLIASRNRALYGTQQQFARVFRE